MIFRFITPNRLTGLRLVLALAVPFVLSAHGNRAKFLALVVYVFAALTDVLDGILARRRQQVTSLGKILDPVADKVLVLGAIMALAALGTMSWWWLLPFAARELSVTAARMILLKRGQVVGSLPSGKLKVVGQHVAVLLVLLSTVVLPGWNESVWFSILDTLALLALIVVTWMTVQSGYEFFKVNSEALFGHKN